MKTQVIQLEVHDDVISIRDKMAWAKTDRILLVLPRKDRLRMRPLDLRLLRRHAVSLGAELALVTRSLELRRLAREEGIPSFGVVSRAQRRKWEILPAPAETPTRQAPPPDLWEMRKEVYAERDGWQNLPVVRISFFALAVLTVLVLLVLFLPAATIQLTPRTKLQSLSIPASAGPAETTVNLAGSLPARTLSMLVEKSQTARATGTMAVPGLPALGTVRFRNLTNTEVLIPAGTVVRTTASPSTRFATIKDATVPASAGKTVDVTVRAVLGGKAGNLPVDALTAMEADLGASLAVTNPQATSGGTDKVVGYASEADRTRLRDALQKQILLECKDAFVESAGAGALLFPDTLQIAQVVSETYLPAEGQPGDTLSLGLNVQCQEQYASAADITQLARMGMDVNLPAGYEAIPDGAIATVAEKLKTDTDGVTHWILRAERLLQARIDPAAAAQLAQGRRPARAVAKLSTGLPLDAPAEIHLNPSWWPWLPAFPFRITVTIGGK